jgi:ABC-type glycerol-3-phosphate transport system permease component
MIPFEALAIPLYSLINKIGLVDTFIAIVAPGIADGMVIFLFRQFFEDIPDSLIDAGYIDGANLIQVLMLIIVPLSTPVIVTAGLVVFISNWNAFIWPLIIAHTPALKLIQVALTDFKLEHAMLWSELFAASTISTILPILLFMPFQKYYIQGISSVGIKG